MTGPWPASVLVIDREGVGVARFTDPMAVGQMGMVSRQFGVLVLKGVGALARPHAQRDQTRQSRGHTQKYKGGRGAPMRSPHPARG
jgi:hypothetical protein